jgi:TRAP-type C4-dicarboxylate transport system permease small subunit
VSSSLVYASLGIFIVVLAALRAYLHRRNQLAGWFRFLRYLEVTFIGLLLAGLIGLGVLQIVLRNFFQSGLLWADPLMRHIVLWLGCLGAALATAHLRHINIDVFTRLLPARLRPVRRGIIYTATAVAAFVLGIAALRLVSDEREYGDIAFGSLQTWMLQIVLPFAFFLIAYRSLVNLFTSREARLVDGTGNENLESMPK